MLQLTSAFQKNYEQLNEAQKSAVDQIDGPVMVVAGPGTGKTQVLTMRIANILLKTDTDPSSILALTFTESAAKNMRQRLVKLIGKEGYYVQISTFHSFCSQVIQDNPQYFPINRDSRALSMLEKYEILEELIDRLPLEKLYSLNAPYIFLNAIESSISDLKREGVNPDEFEQIIAQEKQELDLEWDELKKTEQRRRQKDLHKHEELLQLYRGYEKELRARRRYDFDDMIALVVEAFEQEQDLLLDYQEKLHYFLVDEYQDTNTAQNQVVDLLASYWGERANVFVVGDPNQAIYRFQGASVENMLSFVRRYQQARVIPLEIGYRCPQVIYQAAAGLIKNNNLGQAQLHQDEKYQSLLAFLERTLNSANQNEKSCQKIKLFQAPVQTLETVFVAKQIKNLIEQGEDPAEIAILYLYNRDAELMAEVLDKWGIRYEIDGGGNIFQSSVIMQLLDFFQVLQDLRKTEEDELLYQVLQYEWLGLDALQVMKLGRIAGKERCTILELFDHGYDYLEEHEYEHLLTEEEFNSLAEFHQQLYDWSIADQQQVFTAWFEMIIKESGFLPWIQQQPQKIDLLNQLNTLYAEIKSWTSEDHNLKLKDFLRTIELMKEHKLKINAEDLNIKENAVRLSTVHKAKGQEWNHVFLLHCVDKKWSNKRRRVMIRLPEGILQQTDVSHKERNEDERRVFYVAMTRARQNLTITYPETVMEENRSQDKQQSQFIDEIEAYLEKVKDQDLIDNADQHLAKILAEPPAREVRRKEKEFFTNLVANFKLSVTALNSYLRDPKQFVENNLLRVPRAKPMPMVFGTAVHQALEDAFSYYLDQGKKPDEDFVVAKYEESLRQEVLTEKQLQERLAYGEKVLRNYWQQTIDEKPEIFKVEEFFGSGWRQTILDRDIYLTGRIDRIDWVDREEKLVRVLDYKTGKNKSENTIEGKTKAANLSEREQKLPESVRGPYKRQLLFYKLLTELDRSFIPTVTEGVFEFVEPYKKGRPELKPRKFKLKQEDVEDLKKLIREVMQEIRELRFLQYLQ